jgi:hypothetical protein
LKACSGTAGARSPKSRRSAAASAASLNEVPVPWTLTKSTRSASRRASQGPPGAIRSGDVHGVRGGRKARDGAERVAARSPQREQRHAFAERHAVALGAKGPRHARAGRFERVEAGAHPSTFGVVTAGQHQIDVAELEPTQPQTDGQRRRRAGRVQRDQPLWRAAEHVRKRGQR